MLPRFRSRRGLELPADPANVAMMLDDRSYMRGDYPRQRTTALVWLVAAIVSVYVLQWAMLSPWLGAGTGMTDHLRLTVRSVQQGQLWTLLTHGFLHSTANPLHVVFSLLGVILLGRELEPHLGSRNLAALYGTALLTGGGAWLLLHWQQGGFHLGPSAAIFALVVVLASLHENKPLTFMPFFLFSMTVRPMTLVYGFVVVEVILLLSAELPGSTLPFGYTPSAHLGGMLAGWLYFRLFHARNGWDRAPGPALALPAWLKLPRREPQPAIPPVELEEPLSAEQLRADADRILDKINSHGFRSLTPEERRTLDAARHLLNKR